MQTPIASFLYQDLAAAAVGGYDPVRYCSAITVHNYGTTDATVNINDIAVAIPPGTIEFPSVGGSQYKVGTMTAGDDRLLFFGFQ